MEQNVTTTTTSLFELQVDPIAGGYLRDSAKWGKFLAIVGFVFCGFIALIGLFAGSIIGSVMNAGIGRGGFAGGAFFTFIYLVLAVLYFFPCLFLFHFSNKAQAALRSNDQEQLVQSFKNLRAFLRYVGIMTIIGLGLMILWFLLMMVFVSSAARF